MHFTTLIKKKRTCVIFGDRL